MVNNSRSRILNTPLRRLRKAKGWPQVELARRSGRCLGSVSLAERSGHLTPEMAESFAAALGVPVEDLLSEARP